MNALQSLELSAQLIAIPIVVSSLELMFLTGRGEFSKDGAWDWRVVAASTSPRSAFPNSVFRFESSWVLLLFARVFGAGFLLFFPWGSAGMTASLAALTLLQFGLNVRLIWGDDGSDQMTSILLVSLLVAALTANHPSAQDLCLYFIAAQLTLSYFCSGCAKMLGAQWRNGTALMAVVGHYAYGNERLYDFLIAQPGLAKAANYAVMIFQLSFPIYWLVPPPLAYIFLVGGATFHFLIAVVMRLNGFLFSFIVGYPALVFCHNVIWKS
jgi:hypothetical protein